MRALLALAAVLAVVGAAQGHVETFSQAQTMRLGPYSAVVEPYPSPMYANSALTMRAVFSANGTYATQVTPELELTGPSGVVARKPMEPDGTGYFIVYVAVQSPGEYTARLSLEDAGGGAYENSTGFTVYPDVPVRIRPGDPSQADPYTAQPYRLTFEVLDNQSMRPTDKLEDLTVRLEHWTDDHGRMLGEEERTLAETGPGMWTAEHSFREKGMYHMRFASRSGGFNYNDTPILHVYANDPPAGESTGGKDVPSAGAAALAAAAVAAALLTRRR